MLKRLSAALAVAAALVVAPALTASASTTGNYVTNYWRSTGNVTVYYATWSQVLVPSYQSASNVQCFTPAKRAVSQWGGVYSAGVKRCFTTNGNSLVLTVG